MKTVQLPVNRRRKKIKEEFLRCWKLSWKLVFQITHNTIASKQWVSAWKEQCKHNINQFNTSKTLSWETSAASFNTRCNALILASTAQESLLGLWWYQVHVEWSEKRKAENKLIGMWWEKPKMNKTPKNSLFGVGEENSRNFPIHFVSFVDSTSLRLLCGSCDESN